MSGALDGTEKNWVQKLDHPMLVQPTMKLRPCIKIEKKIEKKIGKKIEKII